MTVRGYFGFARGHGAIAELDGLRAFAILLVLGRHAVRPFWQEAAPLFPIGGWDAAAPLLNGWIGVDLFFVLSGFLIAHHILRRWGDDFGEGGLRAYFIKRALRVVPAYYAVLFIAALGWFPGYAPAPDFLAVRVAYHMMFFQDYLPSNIVVPFWSLGVEEKFYLLAPILLIGLLRLPAHGARYAMLAVLIVVPLGSRTLTALANPDVVTYADFFPIFRSPFHVSFDGLAVGTLCALVYRDRARLRWLTEPRVARGLFWAGLAPVAGLLLAVPLLDTGVGWFAKTGLQTLLALGMGGLVLGAALGGAPGGILRQGWLLFLAKISFSLYLVHLALLPGVRQALDAAIGLAAMAPATQSLIFMPIFVAVSIGAALLLHYAVEKPFLLLKDRWDSGEAPQRSAAARVGYAG